MSASGRNAAGYFGLRKDGGRWAFEDPHGNPFFSVGLNHADDSNLKYLSNVGVWRARYGSRAAWIEHGVRPDFDAWGFNTIGWTAECVSANLVDELPDWKSPFNTVHSKQWERADFDRAGLPYCIALPVAAFEGWNDTPRFPDVFSKEFEDTCAYVARSLVADHADSPNLVGYFLADVPTWAPHPTGAFFPGLDPRDAAGLAEVARTFYRTVHDAIRAYDAHHLILGDRYNGNLGIPDAVLDALGDHVDVLSVQYFTEPSARSRRQMRDDLAGWHERTGKPVLIADIGNWCATEHNPQRVSDLADQAARAADYVAAFEAVVDEPWLIGWHWCAYVENYTRGWGLKSPEDEAYAAFVDPVGAFNKSVPARRAGGGR